MHTTVKYINVERVSPYFDGKLLSGEVLSSELISGELLSDDVCPPSEQPLWGYTHIQCQQPGATYRYAHGAQRVFLLPLQGAEFEEGKDWREGGGGGGGKGGPRRCGRARK